MLDDILEQRRKKLDNYAATADPYPTAVRRTAPIGETIEKFSKWQAVKKKIFLVGRIFSWRDQGQIIFADLRDESGGIQLVLNKKQTKNFELLKNLGIETVEKLFYYLPW